MDSTFSGGAPLPPIRFRELAEALLARAETLVPAWLPGGRREGHEYKCGSLRGGDGRSCSVAEYAPAPDLHADQVIDDDSRQGEGWVDLGRCVSGWAR